MQRRNACKRNAFRRMGRVCVALLGFAGGLLIPPAAAKIAAERGGTWPPMAYRLDEARLRVEQQAAHGLPPQQLVLMGTGHGVLERRGRRGTYAIDRDRFLDVINELYRIRFFDLPAQLRPRRSVFAKDDGMVGTQALKMFDAASTTVCFSLPSYEKCVTYQIDPPRELEELIRRIFADAESQTEPGTK